MRAARATRTRGRKRRPITRRDWRSGGGARTRVWTGSHAQAMALPLFLPLKTQHMKMPPAIEWVGAATMLLAALSWGMLAALLGS